MHHPILLFDGECNFCRACVHWLVQHDPLGHLHYAPLQSDPGRDLLRQHEVREDYAESVVLIDSGRVFYRSSAVLRCMRYCQAPWSWLRWLKVVPRPLRNLSYEGVSQNRPVVSRAVGTIDHTYIPEPAVRERFLAW